MVCVKREHIKLVFTLICCITASCMTGYWIVKYQFEDRSIGLVDYASLKYDKDIKFPVLSLCFSSPFVKQKFQDLEPRINESTYFRYMRGLTQGYEFEKINYQNVTLDIKKYFLGGEGVQFKSSDFSGRGYIGDSIDHTTSFNGFYQDDFIKCFSLNIENRADGNYEAIMLSYDMKSLLSDLHRNLVNEHEFLYTLHYPGQFLYKVDRMHYMDIHTQTYLKISVDEIEVLQRRSVREKKCAESSISYDRRVVDQHILSSRCRAPYLESKIAVPMCYSNNETLKAPSFEYYSIRAKEYEPDCQIMSKIGVTHEASSDDSKFKISLQFPERMRIITQSKEVDIHSLIGNIGGYIGLFLGYSLVQLPDLLFFVYDYLMSRILRKKRIENDTMFNLQPNGSNSISSQTLEHTLNQTSGISKNHLSPGCMDSKQAPLSMGNSIVQIRSESFQDINEQQNMLNQVIMRANELERQADELKTYALNLHNQNNRIQKAIHPSN